MEKIDSGEIHGEQFVAKNRFLLSKRNRFLISYRSVFIFCKQSLYKIDPLVNPYLSLSGSKPDKIEPFILKKVAVFMMKIEIN
ncbi:MAG: hypothetical protein LUH10_04350 [Tannerellaceae bacterium]|nr:hypothetical protein [Tannerellaceae bacterium]